MTILYDHQAFSMQDFGGVSKIYAEVSKYLRHYPDVFIRYPRMISDNDYIYHDKVIGAITLPKSVKFPGRGTVISYLKKLNSLLTQRAIQKGDFDIFHPSYYDPYYLSLDIRKPTVVTCYDLIHEKYITNNIETLTWKKKVLESASKIIAISEHTKLDLIDYYKLPPDRIAVTLLGSSFNLLPSQQSYVGPPFFLYVGHRDGYKNFSFFVKSIAPLLIEYKDLRLYCAGARPFNKQELNLLSELKVLEKVFHFNGSNEKLVQLYSQAIGFFCPSLYEGFGIPILEAMSCRCPVITSNRSSLPEVAGDAALYFDPENADSIYEAALKVLTEESVRTDLIDRGIKRLPLFSWENTARATYNVYKEMI